jgi:hypothetical protein
MTLNQPCQYPEHILPFGFIQNTADKGETQRIMNLYAQGKTAYAISKETGILIERVKRVIKVENLRS